MEEIPRFNPFTDRLSRDIRNELSSALATSLRTGTDEAVAAVAERFLATQPPKIYLDYIRERLSRYKEALRLISGRIDDPFLQGFILWDLELFFEMHEVLEHSWYHAKGETKLLMQALIRSAGFYIKMECGYTVQAQKMAAKALPVLERQHETLARYFPPELLILPLRKGNLAPPKLLAGITEKPA